MKTKTLMLVLAAGCVSASAGLALAQNTTPATPPAPAPQKKELQKPPGGPVKVEPKTPPVAAPPVKAEKGGGPSEAEMQAWMAASMPGEHHKHLDAIVGSWTADTKFWMNGPDAPADRSMGVMINSWTLDGRFVRHEYTGSSMNMPFRGVGYMGYDNIAKAYTGMWMDTMSTNMMTHQGQCDADHKVFTMTGEFKDPMGKMIKSREVITLVDKDTHTMFMYHTEPGGKEMKVGEIIYKRTTPENAAKVLKEMEAAGAAKGALDKGKDAKTEIEKKAKEAAEKIKNGK